MCIAFLYKKHLNTKLDFEIHYDPKSLNKNLKQDISNYFQESFINQVETIINQKLEPIKVKIHEGKKEMIGIKIADTIVRKCYKNKNNGNVIDITKNIDAILNNLLEKGEYSNNYNTLYEHS